MSEQDGLNQQDFEDLIRRLAQRKQETPSDRIPFQDVKDILQEEGLLESLLKEHITGSNQSLQASEQRHRRQKSLLTTGFAVLSLMLAGLSGWGGYAISNKMTVDNAEKAALSAQEKLAAQIQSIETKAANLEKQSQEYEHQLKEKDAQIKDLISKVASPGANIPKISSPASNIDPSQNVSFDSIDVALQSCNRSGKSVICSLNITSKVDRTVGVGNCSNDTRTRFFDLQGNEYRAKISQFGSQLNNSGCTVRTALIKEVPAKAVLTFNDVPLEVDRLKVLEVSVAVKNENAIKWEYPQYREIAIK
jgi:cell division protein FtsB